LWYYSLFVMPAARRLCVGCVIIAVIAARRGSAALSRTARCDRSRKRRRHCGFRCLWRPSGASASATSPLASWGAFLPTYQWCHTLSPGVLWRRFGRHRDGDHRADADGYFFCRPVVRTVMGAGERRRLAALWILDAAELTLAELDEITTIRCGCGSWRRSPRCRCAGARLHPLKKLLGVHLRQSGRP